MKFIKAIIKISRPINFLITYASVVIAAYISGNTQLTDLHVITGAFSFAFSFSAGNIINDIFDFEIDKINRPDRILPSKILSIGFAQKLYIIFLIVSTSLSIYNGADSIIFLAIVNTVLFLYSYSFQKIIVVGNLIVAMLTASALIYGAMINGNIQAGIIPAAFAFLINLIREIIKDIEDIDGDKAAGSITLPLKSGINFAVRACIFIVIATMIFTLYPFLSGIYRIEYFIIIMVLVNPFFVRILKELLNPNASYTKASMLLKVNMLFGLLAILLGAIN